MSEGAEYIAAAGGIGGLGNASLSSQKRRAPGFALLGIEGESSDVVLELKSIADIALVGFPSAGKSSLIAAMSAARPKIADYPFTTLIPNLGVVQAGDVRFTIADVPGLIEGASEGKGLGHHFLRHVERCAALVHVLDCGTLESDRDPLSDLAIIEAELEKYAVDMSYSRHRRRSGSAEPPPPPGRPEQGGPAGRQGHGRIRPPGTGIPRLQGLRDLRDQPRGPPPAWLRHGRNRPGRPRRRSPPPRRRCSAPVLRPRAVNESGFKIRREEKNLEPLFRVLGDKPVRWVKQTDFTNEEAIGYLADRLAKLGVENELFKQGAKPGDTVVIGEDDGVVFDWEPTMMAGAELLAAPRGTDVRFAESATAPPAARSATSSRNAGRPRPPPAPSSKPSARPASGPNPSAAAGSPSRSRRVDWAQTDDE